MLSVREIAELRLSPTGTPARWVAEIALDDDLCCGVAHVEGEGLLLFVARRDGDGGSVAHSRLDSAGAITGIGRLPCFVAWRTPDADTTEISAHPEPDAQVLREGVWLGVFHQLPSGIATISLQARDALGQPLGAPAALTVWS
jgi:hypothetical protein